MAPGGVLAIHQYFPTDQRYGKDQINGLQAFLNYMFVESHWIKRSIYTNYSGTGIVLLGTFCKRK